MFDFAFVGLLLFCGCAKEIKDEQIRQDVNHFYVTAGQVNSSGNLNCSFSFSDLTRLEKLSRDEKIEIKVRVFVTMDCSTKKDLNPFLALGGSFEDNMAKRKPGVSVYQECLSLSYEVFDEGFKLRDTTIETDCSETAFFKATQKTKLEASLKETALAACTCKHMNCAEQAIMDECGVREEKDLNGDGINELLVSDTCQGNGPICNANLWSIVDNTPTIIFDNPETIKDVPANTDGSFPALLTTDDSFAGSLIMVLHIYNPALKKYVARKRTVEKVRKIFFVGQEGSEVFVNNNKLGELKSAKSGDPGELTLNNLPNQQFRLEIRKSGYKTFYYDWDWDNVPRVFTGGDGAGYINQELEKE